MSLLQKLMDEKKVKFTFTRENFKALGSESTAKTLDIGRIRSRTAGVVRNGMIYPLFKKGSTTYKLVGSRIGKEYNEFLNNPSKEKYIEIVGKLVGMPKEVASAIFDYANSEKFQQPQTQNGNLYVKTISREGGAGSGQPKPKKKKMTQEEKVADNEEKDAEAVKERETPIETRPREFDQEDVKYKRFDDKGNPVRQEGKEMIKGKVLRTDLLKKGEFGYVLKNKVFPMFKVDILASGSNSWSFVEDDMLPQEKRLFKTMSELNDTDALKLYRKFYQEIYNIPLEVINQSYKYANNPETKALIKGIGKNYGTNASWNKFTNEEGFNLSNYDSDQGVLETFMGVIRGFEVGNRADVSKYKFKAEQTEKSKTLRKEEFQNMSMSEEEQNTLFAGFEKDKKFKRRTQGGESKGDDGVIDDEEDRDFIGGMDDEIRQKREEELRQQNAPEPAPPVAPSQPAPSQPPPNAEKQNVKFKIEEKQYGENLRANEIDVLTKQDESKKEEMQKDNIPDISKYGHQMAVQNIFKKHDKDFTFFKNLIKQNKSLKPSEDKQKRKNVVDVIIAEYSSLFPIEGVKSDYEYEECCEIVAFKYCYVENIRFDKRWKKAIGNIQKGTNEDISQMSRGMIVNMDTMGISVGDFINRQQNPQTNPQNPDPNKNTDKGKQSSRNIPGNTKREPYNSIRKPFTAKPKSTPKIKRNQFKSKEPVFKIRKKSIKSNLLFSNLKHQPNQQNIMQSGTLPMLRIKTKVSQNRFKL